MRVSIVMGVAPKMDGFGKIPSFEMDDDWDTPMTMETSCRFPSVELTQGLVV